MSKKDLLIITLRFLGIVVVLGCAQSILSTLSYSLFTTTQEQYNIEIITSVVLLVSHC